MDKKKEWYARNGHFLIMRVIPKDWEEREDAIYYRTMHRDTVSLIKELAFLIGGGEMLDTMRDSTMRSIRFANNDLASPRLRERPIVTFTLRKKSGKEHFAIFLHPDVDLGYVFGRYYGFPECCIREFSKGESHYKTRQFCGTGFVPCAACNEKPAWKILKDIRARRIAPTPFPDGHKHPTHTHHLLEVLLKVIDNTIDPCQVKNTQSP